MPNERVIIPFKQREKVSLHGKPTLIGDVGETSVEIFSQMIEETALEVASTKSGNFVDIVIKSRGGEIDEAHILVQDLLRIRETYGVKIRAYAKGYADSSATFVVAMCDERIALGHTEFLLHEPQISTDEPLDEPLGKSRQDVVEARIAHRRMIKTLAKRIDRPFKEVFDKAKEGKPMNEHEALEFGIIDRIVIFER